MPYLVTFINKIDVNSFKPEKIIQIRVINTYKGFWGEDAEQ